MNDFFIWKGRNCREYGIHVTEQPQLTIPEERVTFTDVPGRSGSMTQVEGIDVYNDLTLTTTCFVADTLRVNEIAAWLKGAGTVTFANRQGGFYYARIVNQIPFERILRGHNNCSFAVNFRCKPFWYEENPETITLTAAANIVTNPGNVHSRPLMTVHGSGDITLIVGDEIIELNGLESEITLDSELQEAYFGDTPMNSIMEGDFPILLPGPNAISWTGDVTSIVIEPRWRYL